MQISHTNTHRRLRSPVVRVLNSASRPTTNIVIVGASAGGFLLYRKLSVKLAANSNIHLIVIEPRKFVLHHPSSVTPDGELEHMSIMHHLPDVNNSKNTKFVYAKPK
jgi:NADH dehydrogenase FAD-containing subunit